MIIDKEFEKLICEKYFYPEENWKDPRKMNVNFKHFKKRLTNEEKKYLDQRFEEKSRSYKEDIWRIRFEIEEIPKCEICGKPCLFVGSINKIYKAHCGVKYCSTQCNIIHGQTTKLKRYGSKGWNNMEKNRQTCLERYGVEFSWQADIIKKHIKDTKRERYGDENYNNMEKNKATIRERYGTNNVFQTEWCKNKIKQSMIEHYGVEHALQNKEINTKMHNTMKERYGYRDAVNVPEYREKQMNTTYERWGAYWVFGSDTFKNQVFEKYLENGSTQGKLMWISNSELKVYNLLQEIFGKNNVISQYKSKQYPYFCDIYVKPIDTYIECHFHPMHGKHKFNPENEEDINILNALTEEITNGKHIDWNRSIINCWTNIDIKKYNTAIKNNLNYICFYSIEEAFNYIDKNFIIKNLNNDTL